MPTSYSTRLPACPHTFGRRGCGRRSHLRPGMVIVLCPPTGPSAPDYIGLCLGRSCPDGACALTPSCVSNGCGAKNQSFSCRSKAAVPGCPPGGSRTPAPGQHPPAGSCAVRAGRAGQAGPYSATASGELAGYASDGGSVVRTSAATRWRAASARARVRGRAYSWGHLQSCMCLSRAP